MRESIQLDQIRCERCVARLTTELSTVEGLNEARVEMGTSSIIVNYEDDSRDALEAAIKKGGFGIVQRTELPAETASA